ncbi:MAG: hypothetical protein M0007_00850 [Actinomycetota bacterium]|jgi:hypothetical protein|nr:hypothetical protein [Actinomycetota bacterium]
MPQLTAATYGCSCQSTSSGGGAGAAVGLVVDLAVTVLLIAA